jgi:chemotaxis protein MotB
LKKRHTEEEHENEERWLLTYSDLITLLMAFFMIMYSLSRVDTQRFKVMAQSLANVFPVSNSAFVPLPGVGGQRGQESSSTMRKPTETTPGKEGKRGGQPGDTGSGKPGKSGGTEDDSTKGGTGKNGSGNESGNGGDGEAKAAMEKLAGEFKQLVEAEGLGGSVTVSASPNGHKLMVRLSESLLFQPGSALLENSSTPLIDKIAQLLASTNKPVCVEGHTDNIPINNAQFHSNWDLSTARAASVIRYIIEKQSFAPELLSASGYGEFRPVAPNDTPENRARNRRVEFVITDKEDA